MPTTSQPPTSSHSSAVADDPRHMAFMARCRGCDHVVMVATDEPIHADAVAEAIVDGYSVDRVTAEYVRTGAYEWGCVCQPLQLELAGAAL